MMKVAVNKSLSRTESNSLNALCSRPWIVSEMCAHHLATARPAVLFPLHRHEHVHRGNRHRRKWLLIALSCARGYRHQPQPAHFSGTGGQLRRCASFAVGNFRTGAIIIFIAASGHAGWAGGAAAKSRHGVWRLLTIPRWIAMRHGALYGTPCVLQRERPHTVCLLAAVATAGSRDGELLRARAESLISCVRWLHGASRADGAPDHWRSLQSHGARLW